MKKIRMNVDDLQVDSFQTLSGKPNSVGTVRGYDYTQDCPGYTCTKAASTCEYPTAVYHCCPDTYSAQPACWNLQPRSYYCFSGSDPYDCSAPNPC